MMKYTSILSVLHLEVVHFPFVVPFVMTVCLYLILEHLVVKLNLRSVIDHVILYHHHSDTRFRPRIFLEYNNGTESSELWSLAKMQLNIPSALS